MYTARADSSRIIEETTTDHFFNISQQNQNGDDNDNQIQELVRDRDIVFRRSTESSQSSNESLNPIPGEVNIIDDDTDNELWLMALMITGMFIWIWNLETS